jgi:hypothetical protein
MRVCTIALLLMILATAIVSAQQIEYVGEHITPSYAEGVFVRDNYAYLAVGSIGLQIIDISDPTNPTLTGTFNIRGSARNVFFKAITHI